MTTIEEMCKKQGLWACGGERSGLASEASQVIQQDAQMANSLIDAAKPAQAITASLSPVQEEVVKTDAGEAAKSDSALLEPGDILARLNALEAALRVPVSEATSGQIREQVCIRTTRNAGPEA